MEWLNYHHLFYFWTVIKEGSFTKAAEKLLIAQSAVSFQVASLESFLGKKLIIRSTSKKLTLTEEGRQVFDQADEIFRQGRELVAGMKQGSLQSQVRFGAIGGLSKNLQIRILQPLLRNPDYEISVDVADAETLLARLRSYHLDAILCDVPFPHSEKEPLLQQEIAKERFCLVSHKKTSGDLGLVIEKAGVYLPALSNPVTPQIVSYLKSQRSRPRIRGYVDDIALLRLLAIETDALVAIPRIGAELELKAKKLFIAHEFKTLHQKFYLVVRQGSYRAKRLLTELNY